MNSLGALLGGAGIGCLSGAMCLVLSWAGLQGSSFHTSKHLGIPEISGLGRAHQRQSSSWSGWRSGLTVGAYSEHPLSTQCMRGTCARCLG